jgi:hypothetical protein
MNDVESLDQYLQRYGRLLAAQAEQSLRPLHVPGRDALLVAPLLRKPFPAQQHVIAAGAKTLRRQKSLLVVGEMGCGKTLLGMGIVHTHAGGRPYRALVFAPGQLCKKWERELRETIADNGFFAYCLFDEAHEEKSAESAQANAMGALAAACKKVLALTGTLIGGYAEHIRPLLLRLAPTSLIQEGFGWKSAMPFSEEYGRIETRITVREGGESGASNRQSRGSSSSKSRYLRPGIMPTLFGRHLMHNALFLGLDEVASNLPEFQEIVQGVPLDAEVGPAYDALDAAMQAVIRQMVRTGDRRFLGAMLQTLLTYPDHPFDWKEVGYYDKKGLEVPRFVLVVKPHNFDPKVLRPKEQAVLDIVRAERALGRQVWVYTTMTGEKDVADRLCKMFRRAHLKAEVLRSTVELRKREDWIARHGPLHDVILSHPKLVETGLDLFDKNGGHNFSTLVFYQTGYILPTLRQASRRAWRIGQRLPCKVYYLYYERTMQARAMALMGKKLSAAHAIEGKFSSDGLVAMGGDDGIEMAMARSLADQIDEGSATRAWQKFGTKDLTTGRDMAVEDFAAEMRDLESLLTDLAA